MTDHEAWEKEQQILEEQKTLHPELFVPKKFHDHELLERVGITGIPKDLPQGYIKLIPEDFIVEEISLDGTVSTINSDISDNPQSPIGTGTVYATLIKKGLSTLDAVNRFSQTLGCDPKQIGYAGIKDKDAVTAQRISFRGIPIEQIQSLDIPGITLKDIVIGKGVCSIGQLKGNRFTLFIRTPEKINEETFRQRIEAVEKNGVLNYYGTQRFGSPRYLSAYHGQLLCQGNVAELVKSYLTDPSEYELPYVAQVRREASAYFYNWEKMLELFDTIPYMCRIERALLRGLIENNTDYVKAVLEIKDQINMWPKSYASYLANKLLSLGQEKNIPLPDKLPLLLSQSKDGYDLYYPFLERDKTTYFIKNLRQFNFISIGKDSSIETKIYPKINSWEIKNDGVVLSFDLPKASYATTILMFLFETLSGTPIPEWIPQEVYTPVK